MEKISLVALTAVRVDQARRLYKRIISGKSIEAIGAAICVTDIGDGVWFRSLGADDGLRRIFDSVTDAVTITVAGSALWQRNKAARPYLAVLAARELFVATGYTADLIKTKQVKKGDKFHKLASVSIAAFGVAATRSNKKAMHATGAAAIGINLALAVDYYKGWTHPEKNEVLNTGVHEVPGFAALQALFNGRDPASQLANGNHGLSVGAALVYTGSND